MGTVIKYGLIDVSAKRDSRPACAQVQNFADVHDLRDDLSIADDYATLELGQWLLDGSKRCFPDEPAAHRWGLFSSSLSGNDGTLQTPVVLDINFTVTHSSPGLTFVFYGAWPAQMEITWFGASGAELDRASFAPDDLRYVAMRSVSGYKRIRITFIRTALPYHFIKLAALDFGAAISFAQDEVQSCEIHEETDLISSTLAANTMELSLYSDKRDLSIVNPTSIIGMLQEDQTIDVYCGSDYYGRFFLENWESLGERRAKLSCIDMFGILAKSDFKGGMYSGELACDVIAGILDGTGINVQIAEEAIATAPIYGWLPYGSRRDALQQVVFALRAIADCSRSDVIRIFRYTQDVYSQTGFSGSLRAGAYPFPHSRYEMRKRILPERKISGHVITKRAAVSGVEIIAHTYEVDPSIALKQVVKRQMGVGDHLLTFSNPICSIEVQNCIVVEQGVNHAVVRVASTTLEQVVRVREYSVGEQNVIYDNVSAPIKNTITVKDATLVTPRNALEVAEHIYAHYQRSHRDEGSILIDGETCAQTVLLSAQDGRRLTGKIERIDLKLGNLIVGKVVMIGVIDL